MYTFKSIETISSEQIFDILLFIKICFKILDFFLLIQLKSNYSCALSVRSFQNSIINCFTFVDNGVRFSLFIRSFFGILCCKYLSCQHKLTTTSPLDFYELIFFCRSCLRKWLIFERRCPCQFISFHKIIFRLRYVSLQHIKKVLRSYRYQ